MLQTQERTHERPHKLGAIRKPKDDLSELKKKKNVFFMINPGGTIYKQAVMDKGTRSVTESSLFWLTIEILFQSFS